MGMGAAEKVDPQIAASDLDVEEQNTRTGTPESSEDEDTEANIEDNKQTNIEPKPCPSIPNMLFKYVTSLVHGVDAPLSVEGVSSFDSACDALAGCVMRGEVPRQGIEILIDCQISCHQSEYTIS